MIHQQPSCHSQETFLNRHPATPGTMPRRGRRRGLGCRGTTACSGSAASPPCPAGMDEGTKPSWAGTDLRGRIDSRRRLCRGPSQGSVSGPPLGGQTREGATALHRPPYKETLRQTKHSANDTSATASCGDVGSVGRRPRLRDDLPEPKSDHRI